jgi:hypothetical protein
MQRDWKWRNDLDKYKAPRKDFKVHGESWINSARELDCYRVTERMAFRNKQITRQAQGTKQQGPHRLYTPHNMLQYELWCRAECNNPKKIQTGQK